MTVPWSQEGTVDESSLLLGDWSEVFAQDLSGNNYRIGNAPEGVLEIGREFVEHASTKFPRTTDLVIPSKVWMKFSGKIEEINRMNVSWLLGQSLAPANDYLYVGALETPTYFQFRGARKRVSDGVRIHFRMHKCLIRSLFSIGGGDGFANAPLELEAMDDTDGTYGGSATNPLGWIWVPAKQT